MSQPDHGGWEQDRARMRLVTLLMWLVHLPSRLFPRKFAECLAKSKTLELSKFLAMAPQHLVTTPACP